jgi:hypothetical protein
MRRRGEDGPESRKTVYIPTTVVQSVYPRNVSPRPAGLMASVSKQRPRSKEIHAPFRTSVAVAVNRLHEHLGNTGVSV